MKTELRTKAIKVLVILCAFAVFGGSVFASPGGTAEDAWNKLVGDRLIKRADFKFVENNPALKNVLIYGDSISMGYTSTVQEALKGKANVYRLYCNGGDSGSFIEKMTKMHNIMCDKNLDGHWDFQWDAILFNVGLHDLKYYANGRLDKKNGKQVNSVAQYSKNLKGIIAYLKRLAPKAKLIYTTTTPVPENSRGRVAGDAVKYNAAALEVLKDYPEVVVNDLYSFTKPNQPKWAVRPGDEHFNKAGRRAQGLECAKVIENAILGSCGKIAFESISNGKGKLSGARPNIILVMTDDQGYGDLACHGHPFIQTPNLDRLYTQSTRFTDFHVSPTCAPTRSALMSGRAPFKNGVTHTILERERLALSAKTVAEVLKTAGYTTGVFGKWHLGDADPYQPDNRGFDEAFIHAAGGIGQNYPGTQGAVPGTGYFDPFIKHNGTIVKTKGYCTDVFFQQALTWIKDNKDKPFFAYIPTNAPHGPFIVADKYKKLYEDKCKGQAVPFLGMITNIDENMGLLMKKVDEWGLADNTLLIFMTDNGSARGSRVYNAGMRGAKGSNHEGGARVPLFMRLPNKIKAGVDVDRLARHYDMLPTLAEITGAKMPAGYKIDGKSLVPLINDPSAQWPDRYTVFHKGRWSKKGAPGRWGKGNTDPDKAKYNGFAVRNEKWRLVGKDELYNIQKDPGEQNNVAEENPEIVKEMLAVYDNWWDEVRPMLVNEDAPLDTGKPFVELYNKQKQGKGIPEWKSEF